CPVKTPRPPVKAWFPSVPFSPDEIPLQRSPMPPRSARSHRSESLYHLPLSSCVKRSPEECLFEPTLQLAHESWAPEATIRTIAYPRQIGGGSQRGDGCFPLIRPAGRRGGGSTLTDVNSLGDCARKLQRRCSRGADVRLESGPGWVVRRSCAAARSMVTEQGRAL